MFSRVSKSIFTIAFLIISISACQPSIEPAPREYRIIKQTDSNKAGRANAQLVIVSNTAKSKIERAEIAAYAAKRAHAELGADVVFVALEASEKVAGWGNALALVTYISDGCGQNGKMCGSHEWDVYASDTQISENELEIWEAWIDNRDSFEENGALNEDKLKLFLAKKFNVAADEISLPLVIRNQVQLDS